MAVSLGGCIIMNILSLGGQNMRESGSSEVDPAVRFQQLLDRHSEIEGKLIEIEYSLEQKECEYLLGVHPDKNEMMGWQRYNLPSNKKQLDVSAKDKKFSLSSVFSRASLELLNTEDRRLSVPFKGTVGKKKKSKKSKGKGKIVKKKSSHRKK